MCQRDKRVVLGFFYTSKTLPVYSVGAYNNQTVLNHIPCKQLTPKNSAVGRISARLQGKMCACDFNPCDHHWRLKSTIIILHDLPNSCKLFSKHF